MFSSSVPGEYFVKGSQSVFAVGFCVTLALGPHILDWVELAVKFGGKHMWPRLLRNLSTRHFSLLPNTDMVSATARLLAMTTGSTLSGNLKDQLLSRGCTSMHSALGIPVSMPKFNSQRKLVLLSLLTCVYQPFFASAR